METTVDNEPTLTINRRPVPIRGERNLLEVARGAGIDSPTFCYRSELSIDGACRLCLVDIEGRGIVASCSIAPEPGMVVRTHTDEIRELRKISLETLLAIQVAATFFFEACDRGPHVRLGDQSLHPCTLDTAWNAIVEQLEAVPVA